MTGMGWSVTTRRQADIVGADQRAGVVGVTSLRDHSLRPARTPVVVFRTIGVDPIDATRREFPPPGSVARVNKFESFRCQFIPCATNG